MEYPLSTIIVMMIVIFILILAFLSASTGLYLETEKKKVVETYNQNFYDYCENLTEPVYPDYEIDPLTTQNNMGYDKKTAQFLVQVSNAVAFANCKNILPLKNPTGFTKQLILQGNDPNNKNNVIMYGYIFWNDTQAIIAFTGSKLLTEWLSDLKFNQVFPKNLGGSVNGMLVHEGFYEIYMTIRDQINNWLSSSTVTSVYITGHSLGGALSNLCLLDIYSKLLEKNMIYVNYTFGSPRVGNIVFAEIYDKIIPQSYRVVNTEDFIPTTPPAEWRSYNYQHLKQMVPFTVNLGKRSSNHIDSYRFLLPECPNVAECLTETTTNDS